MKNRNISFSPPDMSDLEIQEVAEALRSGWITTGPRTKKLEELIAKYVGVNKAVCLNSATAAEELNLRILGIGKGDEVIVPAYTYTASAAAAIHVGATIKFVDSQKDSVEMDYDQLEQAVTDKTKAIVPVDLGGVICDYDRIFEIVNKKKGLFKPSGNTDLGEKIQTAIGRVAIVADCAHALGSERQGKMAGAIADFSSFSFHAVKNFTTAEGGASTWRSIPGIDDEGIYHWFQLYSLHGQSKDAFHKMQLGAWEYDVVAPFYKCNMTDIMAAIGLKQFERYPKLLARRKEIIERYDAMCDELGVLHIKHFSEGQRSCGHLYITRIPWADDRMRRNIITKMAEHGIACNVHYKPLPMMTAYKDYGWDIKDFPNAYNLYKNEVTLPLHTKLTNEDVDYVTHCFQEIIRNTK
ncbi:DegT/DnrJ/EryC1/StrS aminotransferase family protein [Megasphaera vaginalis (ex Srinivasan et al. 2021)]|uniref:DegT/DnrJ/EryC1/StrS aminotransferase family protein n=2 Tax=Megasphaera vaginalis (ex Srinivasan et al. 2021) TaxID=1111454 RepID=U7USJ9_9FIRM|nr:DegT/DnrJ/EryC1/StrS aminotransferase family protein [Megasphaera vaginalis (ex Srinivasan et al. 2021)]